MLGLAGRVTTVNGDLCAPGLIARALNEYDVDSVFHLAAQTLVPTANRAPLSTFETNIRGYLAAARGVPAARRRERGRRLLGQGLRPAGAAPVYGGARPRADLSVRRIEGRCRPARALLLAHVRAAGRRHPVREPLRRRRHEPVAPGPRGDRRSARRAGARDPLGWLTGARLPVRRGRRRGLPRDLARTADRAAARGRRSTPAAASRTGSATWWR